MPPKKNKSKSKKPKSNKVPKAVKAYVDKKTAVEIENKCVQINGGVGFGNALESPDLNAYPMLPITGYWTISQGLGQGGRVGNEIKIKQVMLNYIITPRVYDVVSNVVPVPCHIDLYLGHMRGTPNTAPTSADVALLYQQGSSFAGPVGNLRDMVSVTNKDYWIIKKRWSHKVGWANYQGTGGQVAAQYYANNDFKLNVFRKLDITSHLPKTVKFNDTQNTALSKNLFFMYQAVSANGTTLAANQILFNMEFYVDVVYEDA
jgi:hypothetical protein